MKSTAYWMTGSVGLLSDAAETVVNVIAAATAYLSLLYAARPVDESHTYGHEKIEYFSSGLEGVLIGLASLSIGWLAVSRLSSTGGVGIPRAGPGDRGRGRGDQRRRGGLALSCASGRKHGSIVLEADGQHLMADVCGRASRSSAVWVWCG